MGRSALRPPLLPGDTLGILGGGQLGRMTALAAKRMGFRVVVLDPDPDCPCGQVADEQIVAKYTDHKAVLRLAALSDAMTYEFENVDRGAVEAVEGIGARLSPGAHLLSVKQSRLTEKTSLRKHGIAVADFYRVDTLQDLRRAHARIGVPAVLKTDSGGYDGKGQAVVKDLRSAEEAFAQFGGRTLIWERMIPFEMELGVVCARDAGGRIAVYPVSENKHIRNILDTTIVPARISQACARKAQTIAVRIAEKLSIVGVFCAELFLLRNGDILVNEIAPRPHNSGHYTIEACVTSQFEQHVRVLAGWPLGDTKLVSPCVMVNILGGPKASRLRGAHKLAAIPRTYLHVYGKKRPMPGRKMGHFTVLSSTLGQALRTAARARVLLSWS